MILQVSAGNTAGPGTAYGNAGGPKPGSPNTDPGYYGGGGGAEQTVPVAQQWNCSTG